MKHVWGRGRARVLGLALLACSARGRSAALPAAIRAPGQSAEAPNVAVQILADQRLPRQSRAAHGQRAHQHVHRSHRRRRRGGVPRHPPRAAARCQSGEHVRRLGGRRDRRLAAALAGFLDRGLELEMGVDLNAVGNHEFDEGPDELLRMQNGGCHPVHGCEGGHTFEGADFPFLSASGSEVHR